MVSRSLLLMAASLSACSSIHEPIHTHFGTAAATPTRTSRRRWLRQRQRNQSLPTSSAQTPTSRSLQASPSQQLFPMDTLRFSFNGGDVDNPPITDYLAALCQVDYFYTDFLQEGRPENSFTNVVLLVIDWSFDAKADFPISISYVANATDETGHSLDPEDINTQLASRNFFLTKMVKAAWPKGDNPFHAVSEIQLEADTWNQTQIDQADVKFSTIHCPERGIFLANVSYGFFPDKAQEPTLQEIGDVEMLTDEFMSNLLDEEVQMDNMDIEFKVADWVYTEGQAFPLNISFRVQGQFEDETEIPLDVLKYHLAKRMEDQGELMHQYVKQAVWETPPLKEGTFYNVNKAMMETKVHRFTDEELKESDIFTQALEDDATNLPPEDLPVDLTDVTPAPSDAPTSTSTSPTLAPSAGAQPADATRGTNLDLGDLDRSNPNADVATADDPNADTDVGGDNTETDAEADDSGSPAINIGGFGAPGANDIPSNPSGGISNVPPRPSGGRGPGSRPGASQVVSFLVGPSALRPDQATEVECEDAMDKADSNNDTLLSKPEYIAFINLLTRDDFPGYVFDALPQKLKENYAGLATHQVSGEPGFLIPITKESDNPIDQIVEDAMRKSIICRAMKRSINEVVEQDPMRAPARQAPAKIQFMASCEGENCEENGKESLGGALRNFVESDVKPIYEARHDNAFMAPEAMNITALDEIDCPRHEEDPGDDNVHCFLVSAELKVQSDGDDPEYTQEVVTKAKNFTMAAIDAGLLKESLKLMSLHDGVPSPWVVYPNQDAILSMSPSSSPTEAPSLSPTLAPSQITRAGDIGTDPPQKAPSSAPSSTPSDVPTVFPSVSPTTKSDPSLLETLFGSDGAAVGWAAAGSIAAMIVIQFFRELLVDLVIKVFGAIIGGFMWLFGYGKKDGDDGDESDSEGDSEEDDGKDTNHEEVEDTITNQEDEDTTNNGDETSVGENQTEDNSDGGDDRDGEGADGKDSNQEGEEGANNDNETPNEEGQTEGNGDDGNDRDGKGDNDRDITQEEQGNNDDVEETAKDENQTESNGEDEIDAERDNGEETHQEEKDSANEDKENTVDGNQTEGNSGEEQDNDKGSNVPSSEAEEASSANAGEDDWVVSQHWGVGERADS